MVKDHLRALRLKWRAKESILIKQALTEGAASAEKFRDTPKKPEDTCREFAKMEF